jgi:hypothetical protein
MEWILDLDQRCLSFDGIEYLNERRMVLSVFSDELHWV